MFQRLSPEQKHEQKVQGLLQMIDSQFESMHYYQSSIENQPNFRTEPDDCFVGSQQTKTVRHFKSQDNISKSALSNLLNLVDTNILRSTKLNHSKSNTNDEDFLPKYKKPLKTDCSVGFQNDSQEDRIKTQMTNVSIQDASVQTKPKKQKKLGFFTYEISYMSPKCKNCGSEKKMLEDKSIQNQRAQSNYVNAFKEYTKNESIQKCFISKFNNKNKSEFLVDQKIEDSLFGQNSIALESKYQPKYQSNGPKDLSFQQPIKKNKSQKNFTQIAQDVKIISPPKQGFFINANIKQQRKVLAQPYKLISQKMKQKTLIS
ncbi:unnamed protein product (macronuclear) [Paramecium tetraurelia]|uniref:Uncharacterized protein n=1 Tax=Paramecium tetraurelia TaxID=5888 RepID=A0EA05_PARTE|nr:uncharacterized protein GSPATT00024853001 [Paramecium tetraurelia]CAK92122.1 unnamed protein product [Paramecium tetraurelia]|eukprot:XP_001459519.1 hypothetical protein (macronuclear) [Paramecium tetraurelia strain d4-2]